VRHGRPFGKVWSIGFLLVWDDEQNQNFLCNTTAVRSGRFSALRLTQEKKIHEPDRFSFLARFRYIRGTVGADGIEWP
jgi:hypothetical protein